MALLQESRMGAGWGRVLSLGKDGVAFVLSNSLFFPSSLISRVFLFSLSSLIFRSQSSGLVLVS